MNEVLKLLSTAAAGALEVWVGITTGVALGLSPTLSGAVSIASVVVVGVTLMVLAGGRLQQLIYRNRRLAKRRERIEGVWKRYGILGLALQAPLLTGPLLATLLALSLGAPPRCPASSPPVVDARQRGILGCGTHRRCCPGLLNIWGLANRTAHDGM